MHVQHQRQPRGGIFLIVEEGDTVGEMTYDLRDGVMAIDHTWVSPARRGGGLARALVDAGVEFARSEGLKVLPLCSYVVKVFHEEQGLADLRAR